MLTRDALQSVLETELSRAGRKVSMAGAEILYIGLRLIPNNPQSWRSLTLKRSVKEDSISRLNK